METRNENNDLKPKSTETNDTSWLQDAVNSANDHFPLSGNETDENLSAPSQSDDERQDFLTSLDTYFPLSGGEEENYQKG
jgi:hypothetical protein